jgi:RNA polymerase sigma-B factor
LSTGRTPDAHALRRYARSRDPALREQLVARYLPLARHIAYRYAGGREPLEDLVQVANIGLLKAIDRFDPDRGTAFATYAFPSIAGEVRRHFRDCGWLVRPPRGLQEQALLVSRATGALACELNRSPTVGEIARRAGVGEDAVLGAAKAVVAVPVPDAARPQGVGALLRRGPPAGRSRPGRRPVPDADLADHPAGAGEAARRRRRLSRA